MALPDTSPLTRVQGLMESVRLSQGQPGLLCHQPQVPGQSQVRHPTSSGLPVTGEPDRRKPPTDHMPNKSLSNSDRESSLSPPSSSLVVMSIHHSHYFFIQKKFPLFPVPTYKNLNTVNLIYWLINSLMGRQMSAYIWKWEEEEDGTEEH